MQTLVPKDPAALERAPVTGSLTAVVPVDSLERRALEDAGDYGFTTEIRLTGDMISDYQVHGTRLLDSSNPDEIRLGPIPGLTQWQPGELILSGTSGERLGVFLVNIGPRSKGERGGILEVTLGDVLTFTLRIPWDIADQDGGNVQFTFHGAPGRSVTEVFEATDFLAKLSASATCELRAQGAHIITMANLGQSTADLVEAFQQLRLLADDLRVIETEAVTRFRVPERVEPEERIQIRNLRLMLEGHCVAHPTADSMTVRLSGEHEPSLDQFLTVEPKWMLFTGESASIEILGQTISLPALSYTAHVVIDQEQLDAVGLAFDTNTAADHPVILRTRPGDRWRMFLPNRRDPNLPLDLTPWNIPGIYQKGLGPDGQPPAETDAPLDGPAFTG